MNRLLLAGIVLLLGAGFWLAVTSDHSAPITEDSETIGTFTGYYETIVKAGAEDSGAETCHTLVVLDGHKELIAYFKAMVEAGNTVNTLTEDGHLRINLPWEELSADDRTRVLASTRDNPVTLLLRKKVQLGKGAGQCHSFLSKLI